MKGMILDVFRSKILGNCSNDGISSRVNEVLLVGEGIPEIFEANNERPAVKLVKRNFVSGPYYHAEPLEKREGMNGPMFGGTFIFTTDSRVRSITAYPIPLHDRFEKWETKNED